MRKRHKGPLLAGDKIYLRPIVKKDINRRYLSWLNDNSVVKYMINKGSPTTYTSLQKYFQNMQKSKDNIMFAIVTKKENIHIGNVKLGKINWTHRYGDLGIMIGEKRCWCMGYGQEACRLLLEYSFTKLNLNKVFLGVCQKHVAAIKLYKKVGFKVEGRIKDLYNFEGRYMDKIYMGISQQEFLKQRKRIRIYGTGLQR
ncbi:MAG: GNAT family N-acetyltransferase [Candidatus Omnitrophica bacterium]|nr:GNAT family N-acetyltransferase [Candidatus Omnitrophota bacterium]